MQNPEATTYDKEVHWLASMHEPWISACSRNSKTPPCLLKPGPIPQHSGKSELHCSSSSAHDSDQGTSEATRRHCDRSLCWGLEELHTSSVTARAASRFLSSLSAACATKLRQASGKPSLGESDPGTTSLPFGTRLPSPCQSNCCSPSCCSGGDCICARKSALQSPFAAHGPNRQLLLNEHRTSTNRKLHRDKCPTRLTFDESFAQVAQFYSGKAVGDAQPQRGKRLHAEMTRQPRHRNRPNPKAYYHQDQHAQRHDIVRHLPADSLGGAAVKSHVCLPYELS